MSKDIKQLRNLYFEFESFLKKIHGFYLDSLIASEFLLKHIDKEQDYIKELFKDDDHINIFGKPIWDAHNFSHEWMLSIFGKSSQGKSYAGSGMYRTTLGEMKDRNKPDGPNCLYLGNMCVVMLYSYWEHYLRKSLTKAMGLTKSIHRPVWGDLRILRNILLHNKGKANSTIKNMEVFNWYQPGDTITIGQEKFRDVIFALRVFCNWLHHESFPSHSLKIPLQKHKA